MFSKENGSRLYFRKNNVKLKVDENGDGQCYPCMGRSFLTPYLDETINQNTMADLIKVWLHNLVDVALSSREFG